MRLVYVWIFVLYCKFLNINNSFSNDSITNLAFGLLGQHSSIYDS